MFTSKSVQLRDKFKTPTRPPYTNIGSPKRCEQTLLVKQENRFRRLNSLKTSSFGCSKTFPPTLYSGPVRDIMRHLGPCMLPLTHLLLSTATAFCRPSRTVLLGYPSLQVWHPIFLTFVQAVSNT